ncbi:MAG: hypothetical protein HZA22_03925 [Nitrospirae bacterium]|nr:hypothetical protein [Nitrospirota bacterium]MBI5695608.1 hypothetical protein [Nitrospirota bacterium]
MAAEFDKFIGIDYSGAKTPESRLGGLRVYMAESGSVPHEIRPLSTPQTLNWTRNELAHWLVALVSKNENVVIGIDHCFSFPKSYMERYKIGTWNVFLEDFQSNWPTDTPEATVEFLRANNSRTGNPGEFRLCERWTSSAKSVFQFDVQGSVAKSSHAGIAWLHYIRRQAGQKIHFWPFDGWQVPDGKSLITEVYPSIFRKRYPKECPTSDQQDAYSVARWLEETSRRGLLERYLQPPLTQEEQDIANIEGWILGVT